MKFVWLRSTLLIVAVMKAHYHEFFRWPRTRGLINLRINYFLYESNPQENQVRVTAASHSYYNVRRLFLVARLHITNWQKYAISSVNNCAPLLSADWNKSRHYLGETMNTCNEGVVEKTFTWLPPLTGKIYGDLRKRRPFPLSRCHKQCREIWLRQPTAASFDSSPLADFISWFSL